MKRPLFYLTISLLIFCLLPPCLGQSPNVQQVDDILFTLAPGLTIERVATENLTKWPVVADWDNAGRLVIVESGGVAKPIEEHNKQLLHRVIRLVDDDHDGQFDRRIVAADKLPFPEGVLCLGNDMLVSAPPNIWKLTDADEDGICETREIWFDGQTITGCANDLHGPYLGRDGWIYWCKGAFAEQTHELLDGRKLVDSAAHIYRRKISGGAIEPVMSGGMDNPVEVAFTPEGERFFTSTFLQNPGDGLRDGIAHAIYGGVYGKEHHVIHGLVRTGPLMPIMTQLGPAAPSGLACLASNHLLPANEVNATSRTLVAALFNLQKVTAHRLSPNNDTYQTEDIDLVAANRIDFHPTDILEDADGSLLIIDTGGWYDLCCPTSRVDQQTAAGGIYRLRRSKHSTPQPLQPVDWSWVTPSAYIDYLDDPRPWVARAAGLKLAEFGNAAVPPLRNLLLDTALPVDRRLRSLWALSSIGTNEALSAITAVLTDQKYEVVQAACHAVSVHRYQPAKALLEDLVTTPGKLPTQPLLLLRAATEALGRLDDGTSIPALMSCLQMAGEHNVATHSLRYAMLEIGDTEAISPFLDSQNSWQRATAMFLLDQLADPQQLLRNQAVAALSTGTELERQTAIEILGHHLEWIDACLPQIGESPRPELAPLFIAWREQPQLHRRMAEWITSHQGDATEQVLLKLFESRKGQAPPTECIQPLIYWLQQKPAVAIELLSMADLTPDQCKPLVVALQTQIVATPSLDDRLKLFNALPANHDFSAADITDQLVNLYLDFQNPKHHPAGEALSRVVIDEVAAQRIVDALPQFVSRELPTAIELISSARVATVDKVLLERLVSLPTARTLPSGFLEGLYRERSEELRQLASSTNEQLFAPTTDVAEQVTMWLKQLPEGDPVRGLEVFRSPKAACVGCHQLGYVGGRIGPELSRIGASRTHEAILEAILFPSSRIEQSYQPQRVLTLDGQIYNGLVKQVDETGLLLQLTADRSISIPSTEVDEIATSEVSIMPTGMQEVLTKQEIADLLSLLKGAR